MYSAMMIEGAAIEVFYAVCDRQVYRGFQRSASVIECLLKLYRSSIRQQLTRTHSASLLTLTLMQCVAGEADRRR